MIGPLLRTSLVVVAVSVAACGSSPPAAPPPRTAAPPPAAPAPPPDPLGPRPELAQPAPYTPPVPLVYRRDGGLTVWLLERHSLPIVSMELVAAAGSSADPGQKEGLADLTANMLDEGAGSRGALDLSRDIDRLGAQLETGATADFGFAHLTVLKKNLAAAASIFGDVVAKPQMSAVEFKRVHDLWENSLKARQSEPDEVAAVVVSRKLYPAGHPYAHPTDGTLASAAKVGLDDVKKFYGAHWRPDLATLVVVGDVTRAELDGVLDQALASWKAPKTPPPEASTATEAASAGARRVVVVDRPDAPQSVIAVARRGVSASDEVGAVLLRVNAALGGSFTSRLNQDLREAHGWSYGARSRFSSARLRGAFVAEAAVHTEHTGEALKAMLTDIEGMAKGGLSPEEAEKTKQIARSDLVEAFETVHGASARLARDAGAGQPADHAALVAKRTQLADKAALDKAAGAYLDLGTSLVVIVGPRAELEPQLKAIGITAIESSGPEGQ
jgi:predicted Zn-dependent peptidase